MVGTRHAVSAKNKPTTGGHGMPCPYKNLHLETFNLQPSTFNLKL